MKSDVTDGQVLHMALDHMEFMQKAHRVMLYIYLIVSCNLLVMGAAA